MQKQHRLEFLWHFSHRKEESGLELLKQESGPSDDSKQKEQVPVSTDWCTGNSLRVSVRLNKN